jgi:putative phosphoesterase
MRIGLIADIHGNLFALELVLDALARAGVDRVVCLGDVAALGPWPRESVARLRALGCPCVMGNTDRWLLDDVPPGTSAPVAELTRWAARQLSPAERDTVRGYAAMHREALAPDAALLCFHGSPHADEDVISATTPGHELDAYLAGHAAAIYAGGHTHIQLLRRHGEALVLNPGSAGLPGIGPGTPGLPVNRAVTWVEFAIASQTAGRLSIELHRLPLDIAAMLAAARDSGMPRLDWWATLWG